MTWYVGLTGVLALATGALFCYFLYRMVVLDAQGRGLKHPRFWGLFAAGNDSGLLLYLLGRRNYVSTISEADKARMEQMKRKALALLPLFIGLCILWMALFILVK